MQYCLKNQENPHIIISFNIRCSVRTYKGLHPDSSRNSIRIKISDSQIPKADRVEHPTHAHAGVGNYIGDCIYRRR